LTADKGIGGGLYWQAAQRDQGLSVENSTISGNQSSGAGAGAYLFAYSDYDGTAMASFGTGPVSFRNSTIASNTASGAVSSGGGLFENGYTQASATDPAAVGLSSTIVAGNTPTDLGVAGTSSGFDAGNSLVQGDVTGIPFTQNPAGSNVLGANPQLGPLKDNGGPTDTHLPGAGSPAIDAGVANGLSTDQRGTGFPRTINDPNVADHSGSDGTDIGAVEAPLHAQPAPGGGTPTTPASKKCKKKKKHGHKSARAAKKCKKHKKKK
jgi:hypothetical protein